MPGKVGNLVDIGQRLREERKRLGLNQHDFAALGGVKRNSQVDYEAGKSAASVAYLADLERAGVDTRYVVTGDRSLPRDDRREELELVTMRVAMPPRSALEEMFAGILQVYPDLGGDALAQALARHLPSALAQLTDLRPQSARPPETGSTAIDSPPDSHPSPRPAQRK